MQLADLLRDLGQVHAVGATDVAVGDVVYDSRRVRPGDVFVAIPGLRDDGARYAAHAVERGAIAVATERPDLDLPEYVTLLVVPNARRALALLAAVRWGRPSHRLGLVGVTGTDGKTTTSILTSEILGAAGLETGVLTTVDLRIRGRHLPNRFHHTTPEAPEIQESLAQMVEAGAAWAVLETSSHALALDRVTGCAYDVAVLTNVSPEHLDFHRTFEEYRAAKGRLFEMLAERHHKPFRRVGIVNADDPSADYFCSICPVGVLTYGIERPAEVRAREIVIETGRTVFTVDSPIGTRRLETRLVGRFNVYNWLAAIAAAVGQEIGWEAIERAVELAEPVRGRVERVEAGQPFHVLVDFAHTPQAMANALASCRLMTESRMIVVFGAAGDRYSENRPRMGAIAMQRADFTIVTTDDPYNEDPQRIAAQVAAGAQAAGGVAGEDFVLIPDRRRAIQRAFEEARPGDLVLIAGRGHEQYQQIGERAVPFDDARVARDLLRWLFPAAA